MDPPQCLEDTPFLSVWATKLLWANITLWWQLRQLRDLLPFLGSLAWGLLNSFPLLSLNTFPLWHLLAHKYT